MDRKTIDTIFNIIVSLNQKEGHDSIPQSDILYKNFIAPQGYDRVIMLKTIDILKNSNKILIIEIAKENTEQNIDKIEGYVEADIDTLRRLTVFFENALIEEYEKQFRKRLGPYKIIKEIFPKMSQYNNTPIGIVANKAIMLAEYYKLMLKNYYEYTDKWKEDRLNKLLKSEGGVSLKKKEMEGPASETDGKKNESGKTEKRAVDTDTFSDFSKDAGKYSVDRILNIYGANFFFRVYLRKYEFDFLKNIIQKRVISKKQDLELLRSMISKIKMNFERDEKLVECKDMISSLEREITKSYILVKR